MNDKNYFESSLINLHEIKSFSKSNNVNCDASKNELSSITADIFMISDLHMEPWYHAYYNKSDN